VKTATPCAAWFVSAHAAKTFAAVSRKKHALNSAASARVSGGASRVFVRPTRGAFVINASAQAWRACGACVEGSRIAWVLVMADRFRFYFKVRTRFYRMRSRFVNRQPASANADATR
jgi:hypothetical protein